MFQSTQHHFRLNRIGCSENVAHPRRQRISVVYFPKTTFRIRAWTPAVWNDLIFRVIPIRTRREPLNRHVSEYVLKIILYDLPFQVPPDGADRPSGRTARSLSHTTAGTAGGGGGPAADGPKSAVFDNGNVEGRAARNLAEFSNNCTG